METGSSPVTIWKDGAKLGKKIKLFFLPEVLPAGVYRTWDRLLDPGVGGFDKFSLLNSESDASKGTLLCKVQITI